MRVDDDPRNEYDLAAYLAQHDIQREEDIEVLGVVRFPLVLIQDNDYAQDHGGLEKDT